MKQWYTLEELIWLFHRIKGGASNIIKTVTGTLPLVLSNAIYHPIVSLTRYGLCTQDGTPTPDAPVDIMCNNGELKWDSENQRIYADGTPEVLTVSGANLLNTATNITGKYIDKNGTIVGSAADAQYTDLIPVKEGETYVASLVSGRNSGNNRWHGYNANGGWVKQLAYVSAADQQGNKLVMVATIDSGISYLRLSYGITDTEAMVKKQNYDQLINTFYLAATSDSIPFIKNYSTPIQSPHNGPWKVGVYFEATPGDEHAFTHDVFQDGTYVSGNILKVGFYEKAEDVTDKSKCLSHLQGVQQFTVPNEAHYVVIEFDGSTPFTFSYVGLVKLHNDYQPYVPPQTASVPMLLSVGDVKDEVELIHGTLTRRVTSCLYDGTQPVGDVYMSTTGGKDAGAIIVYPLSMPTTEQITAQNLVTNEGTNVVDSVANASPLEAEAKYMTASAQDVLSTLLGMRVTPKDIPTHDAEDMIDIITGEDNK